MDKLETELAALLARAETLSSRHAAADAAFLDAKATLQRHHLQADLDVDDKARTKLEATVAACAVTRDGYADALGEVQAQIADAEQKIAAERALAERKAASEELARKLNQVEGTLPDYLEAARRLAGALEAIHFHYEANEMARFVGNTTAQVEVAAGFTRLSDDLRCYWRPLHTRTPTQAARS
jgi:chromosome segregation ATPase